ncbi:MAG: UDP-4-amino-4,6-dideoxy-N-acetyl-beta-L-altrosamine transaminase [Bacillota bacterium]|nr:UDP-4-amino-4,6-dideoxy-N-acetyl-beta-L-altrosamine transaminase [Bacillota bacterium]
MPDVLPALAGGRPVRESCLPYARQWVDEDDIAAVAGVLRSDWLTTGPKVREFEEAFAARVGARYAVAVSSGTAALHIACLAAGLGRGDEVIVTPMTFAASVNCVRYVGAMPVFADIDPRTGNIAPDEIRAKVTPNTKAVIPVHYTGRPCDLDSIHAVATKHNLIVIEDAAHALGATYNGRPIGSLSDMTVFSLHPVKHVTTGEGGVVTTNSEELYEWLLLFRNHGIERRPERMLDDHGPWYYEMQELGYNYRLTDLQAALGLSQLAKLDRFLDRRREIVSLYNEAFADLPEVETPLWPDPAQAEPAWHLYVLALRPERLRADRRTVFLALRAENIGVHVHYIPVHTHPYYRWLLNSNVNVCTLEEPSPAPRAEEFYRRVLTLPLFPAMTDRDVEDVIRAVRKVILYYRR